MKPNPTIEDLQELLEQLQGGGDNKQKEKEDKASEEAGKQAYDRYMDGKESQDEDGAGSSDDENIDNITASTASIEEVSAGLEADCRNLTSAIQGTGGETSPEEFSSSHAQLSGSSESAMDGKGEDIRSESGRDGLLGMIDRAKDDIDSLTARLKDPSSVSDDDCDSSLASSKGVLQDAKKCVKNVASGLGELGEKIKSPEAKPSGSGAKDADENDGKSNKNTDSDGIDGEDAGKAAKGAFKDGKQSTTKLRNAISGGDKKDGKDKGGKKKGESPGITKRLAMKRLIHALQRMVNMLEKIIKMLKLIAKILRVLAKVLEATVVGAAAAEAMRAAAKSMDEMAKSLGMLKDSMKEAIKAAKMSMQAQAPAPS